MTRRSFENNGRQVQEELIDPGPIPGVRLLRHEEKAVRAALAKSSPKVPMRKGLR